MLDRHTLAHAALAAVHTVAAVILYTDGSLPHALCALAAAVIYAALCVPPAKDQHPD